MSKARGRGSVSELGEGDGGSGQCGTGVGQALLQASATGTQAPPTHLARAVLVLEDVGRERGQPRTYPGTFICFNQPTWPGLSLFL